jgi:hypothetical protein
MNKKMEAQQVSTTEVRSPFVNDVAKVPPLATTKILPLYKPCEGEL